MTDTVIFDLDGTLLDTLEDLTDSVNHAMETFGFPTHTIDEVRTFVGNGAPKLLERSGWKTLITRRLWQPLRRITPNIARIRQNLMRGCRRCLPR